MSKGKEPRRETIDVEDDEARLHRIQRALEKLNTTNKPGVNTETLLNAAGPQSNSGSQQSLSELLARVQTFLPQLEAANAELDGKVAMDPRSVDIENVEGDERVIEMNLGLGVFEDRKGKERSASDEEISDADAEGEDDDEESSDSTNATSSDESSSADESNADSDSDLDSLSNDAPRHPLAPLPKRALLSREIKPLPRRARPEIVVLSETATEGGSGI
ncbi:hypothetical protein C8J57DRAFT_1323861 [Mycena rebaudengoi]|nr:hypothetical protein C8J57DRAFT_1323861 [Mycena rebaudengoi]